MDICRGKLTIPEIKLHFLRPKRGNQFLLKHCKDILIYAYKEMKADAAHMSHTRNLTPILLQSLVPTWVQSNLMTSSVSNATLTLSTTYTYTPFLPRGVTCNNQQLQKANVNLFPIKRRN